MNNHRERRIARAALKGFNAARGKSYTHDEADLRDLLTALMVLAATRPALYGDFETELGIARRNFI